VRKKVTVMKRMMKDRLSNRHWVRFVMASLLVAWVSTAAFSQVLPRRGSKRAVKTLPAGPVTEAQTLTGAELNRRTVERRAVDTVIWGLPLVGEDAVKQAAFRDGKANYNDIVWWPNSPLK
jgi:hypothetical protein